MFEKIKMYYNKGYYQKRHILAFYEAGVLTAEEYDQIIWEDEED